MAKEESYSGLGDWLGRSPKNLATMQQGYLALRTLLGFVGLALPIFLILFWQCDEGCLRTSISAYHHSGMRDVFVGSMCAIGVFLFTYRGNNSRESWVANIAGVGAVALAMLPTARRCEATDSGICGVQTCPTNGASRSLWDLTHTIGLNIRVSELHYLGAGLFLVMIAILCGIFFVLTVDTATRQGKISATSAFWRNVFYVTMALAMAGCLILIVTGKWVEPALGFKYDDYSLVFWFEAVAVWAFSLAWIVKGEFFMYIKGKRMTPPFLTNEGKALRDQHLE